MLCVTAYECVGKGGESMKCEYCGGDIASVDWKNITFIGCCKCELEKYGVKEVKA